MSFHAFKYKTLTYTELAQQIPNAGQLATPCVYMS